MKKAIFILLAVFTFTIHVNAQGFKPVKKTILIPGISAKQIIGAINLINEKVCLNLDLAIFDYVKVSEEANMATAVFNGKLYKSTFDLYAEIPITIYAYDNKCILAVTIVKPWFNGSNPGKSYVKSDKVFTDGKGDKEIETSLNYMFSEIETYLKIVSEEIAL